MLLYINFPSWIRPEVFPNIMIPRWYSLMYIFAFAITYLLCKRQISQKINPYKFSDLQDIFFWNLVGMLIFMRLFYVFVYDTNRLSYLSNPLLIFWPFSNGQFTGLQGLAFHGGIIGVILGGFLFCVRRKQSFLIWADTFGAAVPLGYTLGRLGNFINGELYGRVTTLPWGIIFPTAGQNDALAASKPWVRAMAEQLSMPISGELINLPRHPSQLYEAIFEGVVLWFFLWFVVNKRKNYPGVTFSWYVIGYGLIRFILEYFRQPDEQIGYVIELVPGDFRRFVSIFNLSMGQILNLIMILAGAAFLWYLAKRNSQNNRNLEQQVSASADRSPSFQTSKQDRNRRKRRKN